MKTIIDKFRQWYTATYRWFVDRNRDVIDAGVPVADMRLADAVNHTLSRAAEVLMWYGPSLLVSAALGAINPLLGLLSVALVIKPTLINSVLFTSVQCDDEVGSFWPYAS